MGTMVPIDRTFTALLPAELSQKSANKVEVYSEGLADGFTRSVDLRFKDVLAANPDLVLWVMTPVDVQLAAVSSVKAQEAHPDIAESNRRSQEWASAKGWMKEVISRHTGAIESGFMLRHFLYEHESQSQYIHLYLMRTGGDEPHPVGIDGDANFLRAELSPEWRAHLKEFNGYTAEICNKAKNAGVPIIGVLVPNRAQAAMISMGEWPPGYDPYKLDNELRAIITSHGGTYIDILPYFHKIPNPEKGYFPVDGHLNAKGYAMIADMLSYEFTSGAIPALKAAKQPLSKLAQER
jgi:hypothetical protein